MKLVKAGVPHARGTVVYDSTIGDNLVESFCREAIPVKNASDCR